MPMAITREEPDSEDAMALIAELDSYLDGLYPPESRHGFSVEQLLADDVPLFVLRQDGAAAGCAGVKLFGTEYGEVKRMYVRPAYRGQRLGERLLEHLAGFARDHGVARLRLETGIHQHAAIRLYERAGFVCTGPFGKYRADPLSVFFERLGPL